MHQIFFGCLNMKDQLSDQEAGQDRNGLKRWEAWLPGSPGRAVGREAVRNPKTFYN